MFNSFSNYFWIFKVLNTKAYYASSGSIFLRKGFNLLCLRRQKLILLTQKLQLIMPPAATIDFLNAKASTYYASGGNNWFLNAFSSPLFCLRRQIFFFCNFRLQNENFIFFVFLFTLILPPAAIIHYFCIFRLQNEKKNSCFSLHVSLFLFTLILPPAAKIQFFLSCRYSPGT